MAQIKNLLIDLGGVLLNIDYHKTADAFIDLGVSDFDHHYSQAGADDLFEALEKGNIEPADFYLAMQGYCRPGTTIDQIQAAWCAMLLHFRPESVAYLQQLAAHYNLYLLSNTNSIHLEMFNKIFEREIGGNPLDAYFTKAYYSHQIRLRKPYPATYTAVLQDQNMLAAETMLIDDSINNIEGAITAGLQVHHLLPHQKIETIHLLP